MKIALYIISFLLIGCTLQKKEKPDGVLNEVMFKNILKEVHLGEAAFEINKSQEIEYAQNTLANSYKTTYEKYNVSEVNFVKSLVYYTENPKKLEKIYSQILEELTKKKSTLNQQETN
tara:strand:+ start:235 stop:588 length:354 start_codon:yes stop_codon:yes gene_type:complete